MTIYAKTGTVIHIGRVGEHLATDVVFDISQWIEDYGVGQAELVINQNGSTYPQFTTKEDSKIIWTVTDSNTVDAGMGKCELFYYVGTGEDRVLVKSAIYDFIVTNSLDYKEGAEPPAAYQGWVNDVLKAAANIKDVSDAAEAAEEWAVVSKQWAIGLEEATEEPSNTNNAKYYAQLSEGASITANAAAESARQYSGNPPRPINGTWHIWNAETQTYENTYIKVALSIVKSYPSVEAMEADFANMSEGDLVMINSDINEVNNSKLYIHNGNNWLELSDLSGIEGVGVREVKRTSGTGAPGSTDEYTIYLTDGSTFTFSIYNGKDGKNGDGTGDMLAEEYDSTGAVASAGGIDKYMQEKATKIVVQNWTAADLNN